MADRPNYQIVPLSAAYFEQTAEVLAHYWHLTLEMSKQRLRWKYQQCPLTDKGLFYIALLKNTVVGTLGFFPAPLRIGDRAVNILCPGDGFITPEHRRFGIFTQLFLQGHRELGADFEFFVSLSANPVSAAGLVKIGWKAVAPRHDQSRVNISALIRYLLKLPPAPLNQRNVISNAREIADLYEMIPGYSRVDATRCCVPRFDKAYFQWRYSNPTETYVAVPHYSNRKLQAFALCMVSKRDAFLLDYREQAGADSLDIILRLIPKYAPVPRVIVPTFIFSPDQRRTLSRCGFHDYRPLINCFLKRPVVPILVHPVCEQPAEDRWIVQGLDMRHQSSWLLPEYCNDGY